jgi:hypothetical protein
MYSVSLERKVAVGGTIMAQVERTAVQRVAQVSTTASLILGIVGTIAFSAAGLADHIQTSFLAGTLAFAVPGCLLFLYSGLQTRTKNFLSATLVSIVGGLIMLVDLIAAALSSAYANPCFEIAHCTRSSSFAYVAFNVAIILFLVTAVLGLFVSPLAVSGSARRRRARE